MLLLAAVPAWAAERGFPLIRTYSPDLPEVESQSFDIARDPRGVLYVANISGLLVHDGAWWQVLAIGEARSAFSVASDASGRVGVGGVDDLGYLRADAGGVLRFVSLRGLLAPGQRELGQVMRVHPVPGGFLYLTKRWLLAWDGTVLHTVATFPGDRPYAASFDVEGTVYVWTRERLWRVAGTRLQPVAGGEVFQGRRVDLILPGPAGDGLLVAVRGEGLFRLRNGLSEPFAPEASRWTAEHRLLAGRRLDDGRWALGSVLGGVLLLQPDGTMDQVIDTAVGLPDDFVSGLTVDREGALWVALNNGLARVEVGSPLSVIDVRSGLKGTVYHAALHQGELWAATSAGVFRTEPGGGPLRMRLVPGLFSGWSLLSLGDDLLVGTAFGVYEIGNGPPRVISGTDQRTAYVLAPSADPDRVWVGMVDGLAVLRREGNGWRYEGMVEGVPREVRSIVERQGALWCGTGLDGIVKVALPSRVVKRVPKSEEALPFLAGGRLLATQGNRVLRLDEERGELVQDPALSSLGGRGEIHSLAEDAEGNLWLNTRPLSVALRGDGGWSEPRELAEVPARTVVSIVPGLDGVVWVASDAGLLRHAGSLRRGGEPLPSPGLARVTVGGGKLLFGGAPGAVPASPELEPNLRRLRIELAPLSFRAGLRYQTRLDPVDSGWSSWATEPFAELTRLPPGSYTFHARTVGPGGETSPETAWSFRVLPPWYRTPWALLLWAALALAGVSANARLRGRTLSRRAAELEARVAAQTAELRRTLDELQRAHDELEVANEKLEELSLKDALTGVANRRRLQLVLEDEWSRARRSRSLLAFALLDLDHFKLLNDTYGHREGDRCLQVVARLLAGSLGRHSDVVARYGGEEFAILLPDTGLDGALIVAEQLRQGIEDLAIPHLASPSGRVTASVGVVCLVPAPGQRPEEMVEAADRALYSAKTEGRNRVCAAAGVLQISKVATTGA